MSKEQPGTPSGKKNFVVAIAVVLGLLVGALAIFEKSVMKAASEFFSSC